MPLNSLRPDKWPQPADPWLRAWADRFDALLAGGLAGVDAECLAAALCRLFDDIAVMAAPGAAHDRLLAHRRRLSCRQTPADYHWVADELNFLHDWLSRSLPWNARKQAA